VVRWRQNVYGHPDAVSGLALMASIRATHPFDHNVDVVSIYGTRMVSHPGVQGDSGVCQKMSAGAH
jgi:hypothetical protein